MKSSFRNISFEITNGYLSSKHKRFLLWRRNHSRLSGNFFTSNCTILVIINLFPAAALSLVIILASGRGSYASIQSGLYTYFLRASICLFMPFVFFGSAPEAAKKIRKIFHFNWSVTAVALIQIRHVRQSLLQSLISFCCWAIALNKKQNANICVR
jgi:hypothetical protein